MLIFYRNFLLMALSGLFLSCATGPRIQVFTMGSPLPKDVHEEFAMTTDSLVVAYSFSGESGSMTMGIFNPTESPLFVNWRNSALIIDQKSTPLVIFKGLDTEVIPPKSMVLIEVPLQVAFVPNLPRDPVAERTSFYGSNGYVFQIIQRDYNQYTAPLKLRTHLVIAKSETFINPNIQNHHFFVRQISEHRSEQSALAFMRYQKGPKNGQLQPDRFAVQNPDIEEGNDGDFAIAGVVLALLLAILSNMSNSGD